MTTSVQPVTTLARPGGFVADLRSVALRALRLTTREPEAVLPALVIPLFFFVVNVGALQNFVQASAPPGFSYKAFQLPLAIITAVTGVRRASPSSPTSRTGTSTVSCSRRSGGLRSCSG